MTQESGSAIATITAEGALGDLKRDLMAIPQATDDPTDRMLAWIAGADPAEWDTLWEKLPSIRELAGAELIVQDFRVAPSSFEGRLGLYLILEAVELESGESKLVTCSAEMAVAQLVALRQREMLPAWVEVVEKPKPTRAGFKPIHLRYLGKPAAAGKR